MSHIDYSAGSSAVFCIRLFRSAAANLLECPPELGAGCAVQQEVDAAVEVEEYVEDDVDEVSSVNVTP